MLRLCLLWMQNLEVKDTIHKIKKTKAEIKEELKELIAKSSRNQNAVMEEKVKGCRTNEDAVKAIQEFEQIIQNKKSNIVWLSYYQGQIFQKFRKKERFVSDMVLKPNVSKSTIVFKIALKNLVNDFPRATNSSVSLHYFFEKIEIDQRNLKKKKKKH